MLTEKDYCDFIALVKRMREAQKEFDACQLEDEAGIQRLGRKAEIIENAVDKWLEEKK